MKVGDRVRVKRMAKYAERHFQGKTGEVSIDSGPGEVVFVHMDDEDKSTVQQFPAEEVELVVGRISA
jgi:ribosomal protein L21E